MRFLLVFLLSTNAIVLAYRFIPVYYTPLMLIRSIQSTSNGGHFKLKHNWRSLNEINNYALLAVICGEDQNFLSHHGIDPEAINNAFQFNGKHKRVHGASTITQQTAKNVFLWPGRTWLRKGLEAYFALIIELFWGKERILEVYLNVIELGDGIFGIDAAAETYFHVAARQLNKEQAAKLAVILPNPLRFKINNPTPYMLNRKTWIELQMNNWGNTFDFSPKKMNQK